MGEQSTSERIEKLLATQPVYRLGMYADGRQYIIPMTAAYRDGCIYSFTHDGLKLQMVRKNPEVCVEFERIAGPNDWESVVAWGTCEELRGEEAEQGSAVIVERMAQLGHGGKNEERTREAVDSESPAVVLRIRLREKSGRFEAP